MASGHVTAPRIGRRGVWCIEAPWGDHLRGRGSVRPMLEMLEAVGSCSFIHNDVHTPEEADFLLNQWLTKKNNAHWSVLYVASHGSPSKIHLGGRHGLTLAQLAERLGPRCRGKSIHFGSCSVMRHAAEVRRFVDATRVDHVTGYAKSVDWVQAAAFEVALFQAFGGYARVSDALRSIVNGPLGGLATSLGFRSHSR